MSLHVVFSAECNPSMTWQAIALFHSFRHVGQVGNITRLLACSAEQLKSYNGMDVGPTFVHHNMRFGHELIDETGYPSYNKPASVMFFLQEVDVQEDYIALLDTDMLLRQPLDPIALGARPGVVVSAEYSYLVGTNTPNATHDHAFARRFLTEDELPLQVQCGGFHIFHREDIRRIAPLWIEFTRRVRAFAKASPDAYYAESFKDWHVTEGVTPEQWKVRRRQGLWQAEMYGYIFGAARAGVSHIVRRDTMLYPGYAPTGGSLPTILHYGADYALDRLPNTPKGSFQQGGSGGSGGDGGDGRGGGGGTTGAATGGVMPPDLYFNKMNYVNLDVYAYLHRACRRPSSSTGGVTAPSDTSPLPYAPPAPSAPTPAPTLFFFETPPHPRRADGTARSQRDLLGIQNVQLLNSALCEFYAARCAGEARSDGSNVYLACPVAHEGIDEALRECRDEHALCAQYERSGECLRNPLWMLSQCPVACKACSAAARHRLHPITRPYDVVGPRASAHMDPSPTVNAGEEGEVAHAEALVKAVLLSSHAADNASAAGAVASADATDVTSRTTVVDAAGGAVSMAVQNEPPVTSAERRVGEAAHALGCSEGVRGTGKGWCLLYGARIRYRLHTAPPEPEEQTQAEQQPEQPLMHGELMAMPSGYLSMGSFGGRFECLQLLERELLSVGKLCSEADAHAALRAPVNSGLEQTSFAGSVLLVERGECPFAQKARAAQEVGAVAMLVFDPNDEAAHTELPLAMKGDGRGSAYDVVAIGLTRSAGELLRSQSSAVHAASAAPGPAAAAAAAEANGRSAAPIVRGRVTLSIEGWETAITTQLVPDPEGGAARLFWQTKAPATSLSRCEDEVEDGSAAAFSGCIPAERVFPIDSHAFSDDEWTLLRAWPTRCPPRGDEHVHSLARRHAEDSPS